MHGKREGLRRILSWSAASSRNGAPLAFNSFVIDSGLQWLQVDHDSKQLIPKSDAPTTHRMRCTVFPPDCSSDGGMENFLGTAPGRAAHTSGLSAPSDGVR